MERLVTIKRKSVQNERLLILIDGLETLDLSKNESLSLESALGYFKYNASLVQVTVDPDAYVGHASAKGDE